MSIEYPHHANFESLCNELFTENLLARSNNEQVSYKAFSLTNRGKVKNYRVQLQGNGQYFVFDRITLPNKKGQDYKVSVKNSSMSEVLNSFLASGEFKELRKLWGLKL